MLLAQAVRRILGTLAAMAPQLAVFALAIAAFVFFSQRFGYFGDAISLPPTSAANLVPGETRRVELFTLLPKDAIRSIDDPNFVAASEASLSPVTPVIGVRIGDDARAYPLAVLSSHEIVNDFVGGRAIAVTYCPLCLTGIVFDRHVDGKVVEFGVSGKLLMNVLVMYDRDSDSLWSQILGESIDGARKGTKLTVVDSLQTTWATWRALNPNTLVLKSSIRGDSYASYYRNNSSGVHGGFVDDDRLPAKSVVIGVVIGGTARAYPLASSLEQSVINDNVAGRPLLTVFAPDGVTGLIYDRHVNGRLLTFDEVGTDAPLEMTDRETGSRWNRLTGEALSGPLQGAVLNRIPATNSFWFGWRDFYPNTSVYGLDSGDGAEASGTTS
ncbi:MAG: DUF3179 domain-containing protein [Dehalococcoidia bacterium]